MFQFLKGLAQGNKDCGLNDVTSGFSCSAVVMVEKLSGFTNRRVASLCLVLGFSDTRKVQIAPNKLSGASGASSCARCYRCLGHVALVYT
jgi:hypothetical protein